MDTHKTYTNMNTVCWYLQCHSYSRNIQCWFGSSSVQLQWSSCLLHRLLQKPSGKLTLQLRLANPSTSDHLFSQVFHCSSVCQTHVAKLRGVPCSKCSAHAPVAELCWHFWCSWDSKMEQFRRELITRCGISQSIHPKDTGRCAPRHEFDTTKGIDFICEFSGMIAFL